MNKDILEMAIKLRHQLHQHPESSMEGKWTKDTLISFLREHTNLEIRDRGRWFYAAYRKGKDHQNVAFRADFDAIRMDEGIRGLRILSGKNQRSPFFHRQWRGSSGDSYREVRFS